MTDLEALTLTIWGEARGEPIEGKVGVAMVMRNRLNTRYRGAANYVDVCTAHAQFSAWTEESAQMSAAKDEFEADRHDELLALCEEVAAATIAGKLTDNTDGANHYFNPAEVQPAWATSAPVLAQLGHHTFINVP